MKLQQTIENHWYLRKNPFLYIILAPFSIIYLAIITVRKLLFKLKIKTTSRAKVPVVIVGNISVGGAGKTPLTKYLLETLQAHNIQVGVILRGYKSASKAPRIVNAHDDSTIVGDEALIYAQSGFKVAIGAKRVAAAQLLTATFPEIQLIIADDGLQHYYLARDFEICVVDGSRYLGNQLLLPNGPLRESVSRLQTVDAIVINSEKSALSRPIVLTTVTTMVYLQTLEFIELYNPVLQQHVLVKDFHYNKIMALAAIGNPERFFDYLRTNGLNLTETKIFPDHYHYLASDLSDEYAIITTEKDYTKLTKFAKPNIWVAKVNARLENNDLIQNIINLLA